MANKNDAGNDYRAGKPMNSDRHGARTGSAWDKWYQARYLFIETHLPLKHPSASPQKRDRRIRLKCKRLILSAGALICILIDFTSPPSTFSLLITLYFVAALAFTFLKQD